MAIINSGSGGRGSTLGTSVLIYRYTVSGSVKASIDTGADTPQAGANDWTNGDLLEVYLYARTDEAVTASQVNLTFNNDTGANYDVSRLQAASTTVTGATSVAAANWFFSLPGASATASVFGLAYVAVPNFTGTVGFKAGQVTASVPDETGANMITALYENNYRSASALTRLKVIPNTAAKNFAVGTQLLIYKRSSA